MSRNRPYTDFPRNEAGLVDNFIGTAYDVVKGVYVALPELREIHTVIGKIPELAEIAAEEAMVPARLEIAEVIDKAKAWAEGTNPDPTDPLSKSSKEWAGVSEEWAEAAAQSALDAAKVNLMFPFTFDSSKSQYDVSEISGRTDITTVGMALWVEGAIEYDFLINSTTVFTLLDPASYPETAQMKLLVNARFEDLGENLNQLSAAFRLEFDAAQAERAAIFDEFMENADYEVPVPYTSGLLITRPTQTVSYQGYDYRVIASYLPMTTSNFAADSPKLKLIGDNKLRDEVSNTVDPSQGSAILGRGVIVVPSIKDLLVQVRKPDSAYLVRGYWPEYSQHGGGYFHWDPTKLKSEHNGGTVISPTVPWDGEKSSHSNYLKAANETDPAGSGCFVRKIRGYHYVTDFGAISNWQAGTGFGTGFDNRDIIKHMLELLPDPIEVPKWGTGYAACAATNVNLTNVNDRRINGHGKLIKIGTKGIFSLEGCNDFHIGTLEMDLQVVADEAAAGSILTSTRLSTNYAFGISLARTNRCSVRGVTVRNSAWDAIVAQGRVDAGGATATPSQDVVFDRNKTENIRGSMLWIRSVTKGAITNNHCRNEVTFAQKANAIFVVDWCNDIEVSGNQSYNIGDNAVGVGEPVTDNPAGRNQNIRVTNNYSYRTRYHSILIAQGNDVLVEGNIVIAGGVQAEMPGVTSNVLCGAIMVLGGGTQPVNHRVTVRNNIIRDAYELGIYVVDRGGVTTATGSTNIVLEGNTISRTARPTFVGTRKGSAGIHAQLPNTIVIADNVVVDGAGDGILVYGDASIEGNHCYYNDRHGIHVPNDTLMSNKRLSGPITTNVCQYNRNNGIHVWGKDLVVATDNTLIGNGRGGAPGTEETIAGATTRAGMVFISVRHVSASNNEARLNGGPGVIYRAVNTIRDIGGVFEDNGDKFTTASYKSGCYIEGNGAAPTKAIFYSPIAISSGVQTHPIRGLNCTADSVILDPTFTGHPSGIVGLVEKSLINI